MASDVAAPFRPRRMARSRATSLALATSLLALLASTLSGCVLSGDVRTQGTSMAKDGSMPRRWMDKGNYTIANLGERSWLRDRLGMAYSFLEDPRLDGMMAARRGKS